MAYLVKKCSEVILAKDYAEWFLKENSSICCMIYTHGHWILKSSFCPLHSDILITLLCLILGLGSTSRILNW